MRKISEICQMFTGIIETLGKVTEITREGTNASFWITSTLSNELKVDQSLSHNGVCLTVEEIKDHQYKVTAIDETLKKTNLGKLEVNSLVNLERCLQMNGRLDGHIVQGHVDSTATCLKILVKEGSWEYNFEIDPSFASLIIEKGSITLNGISLTLFNVTDKSFTVAIIPYTYEHTNLKNVNVGETVNVEFDMIGKYVNRMQELKQ